MSWGFLTPSLAPSLLAPQALKVGVVLVPVEGAKWACVECAINLDKT